MELASDSKEFPTQLARTKLAEMTGKAKIVPIAQTPPPPQVPPPVFSQAPPPVQSLNQAPKPPVPPVHQRASDPERGFPKGRGKTSAVLIIYLVILVLKHIYFSSIVNQIFLLLR